MSYHITEDQLNRQCFPHTFVTTSYFWNDMTAYRKLPLEYPLLIARKACRKAMPSLPWLKAKAHKEGFCTSDQEMSLRAQVSKAIYTQSRG